MLFKIKTIMECKCCGECKEFITSVDEITFNDGGVLEILKQLFIELEDTYGGKYLEYTKDEMNVRYVCDDCMMKGHYKEMHHEDETVQRKD